jgi:hypothetical protein
MAFSREAKFALNQNKMILRDAPPAYSEGVNGDQALVKFGNKPPRMYVKVNNAWYYTELKQAASSSPFAKNVFSEDLTLAGGMTMVPANDSRTRSAIQYGNKSIVRRTWMDIVTVNYVDSGNNTVIKQIGTSASAPNFFFPAHTVILRIMVKVIKLTNLVTTQCNLQVSETASTAADSAISSGKEVLGGGAGGTRSTDSATSAQDIAVGTNAPSANDLGEMWVNIQAQPLAEANSYFYLCNAGTGNGTTDPSGDDAGKLAIFVDYMTFENFATE